MRYTIALSVSLLSVALLSGCLHQQDKPLTLVTPKGYTRPQSIEAATTNDSWQKKALMAMVAPSLAEKAEAAEKMKAQSSKKIVAQAKPARAAKATRSGRRTSSVKVAKHHHHRKAHSRREMIARR